MYRKTHGCSFLNLGWLKLMLWSLSTHGFREVTHFQQQLFQQSFSQLLTASVASHYDRLPIIRKKNDQIMESENMDDIFWNYLTAFSQSSGFILNHSILYNISIIIFSRNR